MSEKCRGYFLAHFGSFTTQVPCWIRQWFEILYLDIEIAYIGSANIRANLWVIIYVQYYRFK